MKLLNIIFWSGSGNTETMAKCIKEGAEDNEFKVNLINVSDAKLQDLKEADVIALGCPAMGNEELEESEMEPFISSINDEVKNKDIALFGSYGWGSGEWMQIWEERMKGLGANIIEDSLIVQETPTEEDEENCKEFGKNLVK